MCNDIEKNSSNAGTEACHLSLTERVTSIRVFLTGLALACLLDSEPIEREFHTPGNECCHS